MTLKTLAVSAILGLSLTTLATARSSADDLDMKSPWEKLSDDEIMIPVRQMTYPMAAPGSIYLYHWQGYNEGAIAEGSVNDIRYERERRRDKIYQDTRKSYIDKIPADQQRREEELFAEPVAADYTQGAPGSIHLWHWHGIDRERWMDGSVSDMRYEQEKARDQMWYGENRASFWTEEDAERLREPFPMNYPEAAPGSLHLYHFADYTRYELVPGSINEHRDEREMKRDTQIINERRNIDNMTNRGNNRRRNDR